MTQLEQEVKPPYTMTVSGNFGGPTMRLSDNVILLRAEPVQQIDIPTPPNKRHDWTPEFVKSCAHQGLIEAYPERPDAGPRALVFGLLLSLPFWLLVWWLV